MAVEAEKLALTWTERRVAVADLRPYERNPRKIAQKAYEALVESLRTTGYHSRILATPDLKIASGHQRIQALKELGITEIAVLVPDRELTDYEYRRVLMSSNIPFGSFDLDIMADDFTPDELLDWGMPETLMGIWPEPENTRSAGRIQRSR